VRTYLVPPTPYSPPARAYARTEAIRDPCPSRVYLTDETEDNEADEGTLHLAIQVANLNARSFSDSRTERATSVYPFIEVETWLGRANTQCNGKWTWNLN
jgi:hypothetical protein